MADIAYLEGFIIILKSLQQKQAVAVTEAEQETCKSQIITLKARIWLVLESHDNPDDLAAYTDYIALLEL